MSLVSRLEPGREKPGEPRHSHLTTVMRIGLYLLISGILATVLPPFTHAQDLLKNLDLNSPAFTEAELTRADVEAAIAAGGALDFAGKSLNGLDLSGLDLAGANFRAARINRSNLRDADLSRAILDQAWMLQSDLTGARLAGARLFGTQLIDAIADGADFTGAVVAADFSNASLKGARFDRGVLGADMKNQSMGLMRAVLRSSNLEGASFVDADLSRADLQFARMIGANLSGANLMGADLSGANLTSARAVGTNFMNADVASATLKDVSDADFAGTRNFERSFRN